ncbi:MAG TPA: DUF1549 domain-containing protein [Bryobacteraceae bacterium]|nr:DUF1549 domain-containing protein [Bryobacteraceae bacterium]
MKLAVLSLIVCALAAAADVDFTRDVHPILAQHCFACHAGDKRSGGLSLRDYSDVLKGGRSGPAILPGHSGESLLIRRVTAETSPMPAAGPRLTAPEVAALRSWIDDGARESLNGPVANMPWVARLELRKPDLPAAEPGGPQHPVDRFVAAYLRQRRLTMQAPVSDRVFARRAYLDITGLLPLPDQLVAFVQSAEPDKRARLVTALLANNGAYADHWISFWNDLLRNDEGVNYAGTRKSITPWLVAALRDNMPYDRFVEKLLNPVAADDPSGFLVGVNWRGDINASQKPLMQAAQNSAQVFLGVNLKCNSCHDSFISKWKLKDAYGLAAFFADDTQLELVRCDVNTNQFTGAKFLYPELDLPAPPATPAERKAAVARMFTEAANGRMPRTMVNRVWARLLGRGLVEDVDDMDGEPWSADLLDWLAADFVEHGYDLKHLIGEIVTSQAYQLPAIPRRERQVKDYVFRGPEVRRMTAEEFADALSEITGEWPVFAQGIRGTYSRQWRMPSSPLTRELGRPIRDQVFTERNEDATTLQALELVNGESLAHLLKRGAQRMLGELPPAPENLYDSGRVTGHTDTSTLDRTVTARPQTLDIDISDVRELHLLIRDAGSYSPERVVPAWIGAMLSGPGGDVPLSTLEPTSGQVKRGPIQMAKVEMQDALLPGLPSELVFDIGGKGYTRLRATIGLDDQCLQNDISPAARFFVFREKPNLERLVRVAPETPVESPVKARPKKDELISTVFETMLDREPTLGERRLASAAVSTHGSRMSAEGLADLLWSIAMQPEFQLIY